MVELGVGGGHCCCKISAYLGRGEAVTRRGLRWGWWVGLKWNGGGERRDDLHEESLMFTPCSKGTRMILPITALAQPSNQSQQLR